MIPRGSMHAGARTRCAAAVLLLATPLLLANATGARAETLALVGGTVHPVSGPDVSNGTVVVVDGKITAVGSGIAVPAGAKVIACDGKHVYPGFVSPNTVLGLTEISSVRGTQDVAEVGDMNPDARGEAAINPESELLPVARANGITSAMVCPRGGAVSGLAAVIHTDGWTFEDMTVRAPVGLLVQWPNMTPVHGFEVRVSDEEQKKTRDRQIQLIRDAFDDARAYRKAWDAHGKPGVPSHDRDLKYDAMTQALRGEIPVLFRAGTLAQIQAVLRFAEEEELTRVVLLDGDDAWRVAAELKARKIAVITAPTLSTPNRRWEPYDEAYTLPGRLQQAGVTFCVSDGGAEFTAMNARNLPYHAAMASAFGLPRDEALKSVTLYPAQILGVADRVGSIEPGKDADLIVCNGDPLEIETRIDQVYVQGRLTTMVNRQTRLFDKYDHRPRGAQARAR